MRASHVQVVHEADDVERPPLGANRPPLTALAATTVVLGSLSDAANRSQDAGSSAGPCAKADSEFKTNSADMTSDAKVFQREKGWWAPRGSNPGHPD